MSRLAFVALLIPLVLSSPVSVRAQECIALEDFSAGKVGELPPGWKLRDDEGRGVYTIQEEGGRRYLHAASQGLGIQAAKEITWDLARLPGARVVVAARRVSRRARTSASRGRTTARWPSTPSFPTGWDRSDR